MYRNKIPATKKELEQLYLYAISNDPYINYCFKYYVYKISEYLIKEYPDMSPIKIEKFVVNFLQNGGPNLESIIRPLLTFIIIKDSHLKYKDMNSVKSINKQILSYFMFNQNMEPKKMLNYKIEHFSKLISSYIEQNLKGDI